MNGEILVVAPWLPWPADFGGAIRVYRIVRFLARDERVILLAPATASDRPAFDHLREFCDVTIVPARWTFRQPAGVAKRWTQLQSIFRRSSFVELASIQPRFQAVMDRLFMTRQIRLVQHEFPQMALYRAQRPCPTVLDNHNIEHRLLQRVATRSDSLSRRVFNQIEARKVRRLEEAAWRSVTLNVATSAIDAERVQAVTGTTVPVVPNGVDLSAAVAVAGQARIPGRVVFAGAMRHQPNAEGARWYAEQIHPRVRAAIPDATFEIVGADPPSSVTALVGNGVAVTGRVEDVLPRLARASVVVAPLHAGGGTRLKILEAFAAGAPVVSTTIGAEGIDASSGEHLLIADDAAGFADAVVRALRDDRLAAQQRADRARELVAERYDWESAVLPRLADAHREAQERFKNQEVD